MKLSSLAKRLVMDNIISQEDAENAQESAFNDKVPLLNYLVDNKVTSAINVAMALSTEFGTPAILIDSIDFDMVHKDIVDVKIIEKHRSLPLYQRGNRLFVAVADPTNIQCLDDFKFNTRLTIEPIIVEVDRLNVIVDKFLEGDDSLDLGDDDFSDFDLEEDESTEDQEVLKSDGSDKPVVKFINKILIDAIKVGASDIHFEPYEKAYRVRIRADGVLKEIARPPVNLSHKMAARLKVMSKMDISERRIPQDGRIKLKISAKRSIDFRVNTLPTLWGEKIVLRILDPESAKLGIDMLGYDTEQKKLFLQALDQPQGMILVTGPTGSGKTVSLYTGLNILNTPERNISTAEDPVEINLEGINQVNVNPKVGLDFSSALRSFLRQDPDIVMVGEIRDLETAQIAVKAAQTGHLVLSTLHTNSAPETLTRLRNMGVPSFNIATSVTLIIAQRLARRLCKECKQEVSIPKAVLISLGYKPDELDDLVLYGPKGCDSCSNGYKGRVGIYEVVKITDEISKVIMEDGNSIEIAEVCKKQGFSDLRTSGLYKARIGVTSLAEVERVTAGH